MNFMKQYLIYCKQRNMSHNFHIINKQVVLFIFNREYYVILCSVALNWCDFKQIYVPLRSTNSTDPNEANYVLWSRLLKAA